VAIPNLVPGEILKIPGSEAVGTVKDDLDLGVTGSTRKIGDKTGCSTSSSVINRACRAESNWGTAPNKLLNRVVEVKANGVIGRGSGRRLLLLLKLVNEVLMSILSELPALSGVEINVVSIDLEVGTGEGACGSGGEKVRTCKGELDVELNLVVLESNEGNGKSGVLAEPEAHGNVSLSGGRSSVGNTVTSVVSVGHPLVLGGTLKTS